MTAIFLTVAASLGKAMMGPGILLAMRNYVNPTYSNPMCLMKLVNTTAPEHYAIHPFWKDVAYDASCDLAPFVEQQFNNTFEFIVFGRVLKAILVLAFLALLFNLSKLLSLRGVVTSVVGYGMAVFGVMHLLMISHFEQDITFFSANIMHHSDVSGFTGQSNASLVDTVPQGFLVTCFLNMAYAFLFAYVVAKYDPVASKAYTPIVLVALFGIQTIRALTIIKMRHPVFHEIASEAGKDAFFLSEEYQAYKHVYVHHGNGDSFGSSYLFDWIYSASLYAYASWHNDILKLTLGTPAHYAFATLVDAVMMVVWSLAVWLYMRLSSVMLISMFGPLPTEKAASIDKAKTA